MKKNNIDITKYSRVMEVMESLVRHNPLEPDPNVTFEFICASCFPKVWDNIQEHLKSEYQRGYLEGMEYSKNLTENEN